MEMAIHPAQLPPPPTTNGINGTSNSSSPPLPPSSPPPPPSSLPPPPSDSLENEETGGLPNAPPAGQNALATKDARRDEDGDVSMGGNSIGGAGKGAGGKGMIGIANVDGIPGNAKEMGIKPGGMIRMGITEDYDDDEDMDTGDDDEKIGLDFVDAQEGRDLEDGPTSGQTQLTTATMVGGKTSPGGTIVTNATTTAAAAVTSSSSSSPEQMIHHPQPQYLPNSSFINNNSQKPTPPPLNHPQQQPTSISPSALMMSPPGSSGSGGTFNHQQQQQQQQQNQQSGPQQKPMSQGNGTKRSAPEDDSMTSTNLNADVSSSQGTTNVSSSKRQKRSASPFSSQSQRNNNFTSKPNSSSSTPQPPTVSASNSFTNNNGQQQQPVVASSSSSAPTSNYMRSDYTAPLTPDQCLCMTSLHGNQIRYMLAVLRNLKKQKAASVFLQPVDFVRLKIPDYPKIIDEPMDFATLEAKLSAAQGKPCKGWPISGVPGSGEAAPGTPGAPGMKITGGPVTKSVDDFREDLGRIFNNTRKYNGPNSLFGKWADELESMAGKQMLKMPAPPTPIPVMAPPPPLTPAATSSTSMATPGPSHSSSVLPTPPNRKQTGPTPSVPKSSKKASPSPTVESKPKRKNTQSDVPTIRRKSGFDQDGRPKREIHAPPPKELPYFADQAESSNGKGAGKKNKSKEKEIKWGYQMVKEMNNKKNKEFSWPFLNPVDTVALQIPDYHKIVKRPMDVSTIKKKLDSGDYRNPGQSVEADFKQVFTNCFLFNPSGTPVFTMGRKTEALFESKWNEWVKEEEENEKNRFDEEGVIMAIGRDEDEIRRIKSEMTKLETALRSAEDNKRRNQELLLQERERKSNQPAARPPKPKKPKANGVKPTKPSKPKTPKASTSAAGTPGGAGAGGQGAGGSVAGAGAGGSGKKAGAANGDSATKKKKKPKAAAAPVMEDAPMSSDDESEQFPALDWEQMQVLTSRMEAGEDPRVMAAPDIISQYRPDLLNGSADGNVELDIGAIDNRTLWKLFEHICSDIMPSTGVPQPQRKKGRRSGEPGMTASGVRAKKGGRAGTGGVNRKNLDEDAETQRIKALEERLSLFNTAEGGAGGAGMGGAGPNGFGNGGGMDYDEDPLAAAAGMGGMAGYGGGAARMTAAGAHGDEVSSDSSEEDEVSDSDSE